MKNFWNVTKRVSMGLGIAAMTAAPAMADVYADADAAIDAAVLAIGPLLTVALGIPLAFLAYKVVKRIIARV